MQKQKLIVFASGTKEGGGSGFENLFNHTQLGELADCCEIVGVVSNHEHGGVRKRADKLGVPFVHFTPTGGSLAQAAGYQRIVRELGAEWVALSGWLKFVRGLPMNRTFNIHPALLTQLNGRFGGESMYGHHVHEAVAAALANGELVPPESGFTMHFVTETGYDRGPIIWEERISLVKGMGADDIAKEVNRAEHQVQPYVTKLILTGRLPLRK